MTSVVSICNIALSNIGKDNIQSVAEGTPEARACKQFYDHVRDMMLQTYPWRWAGKTASLAEVANDKPAWKYAYRLPTDCLKVRWIATAYSSDVITAPKTDDFGIAYEIEGDTLYTDVSPALLHYTYRLTDPTKFSALFVEALGWHLSVRLAMPLTRDPKVRADCFTIANSAQASAQTADANEVREWVPEKSDTVEARN